MPVHSASNGTPSVPATWAPQGRPYFVMELVRGIPITDYCDKAKLPPRERLKLFVQVCQAIQHAHQKGVIHRDLKPSNVLVTLHDGVPVPKVIDFGVAKAINQRLSEHTIYTRMSQIVGTPMYMSPEQADLSGLDVDTRSDVYSLGVLLYELLTGVTLFDKDALVKAGYDEMRRVIREVEPPRPSQRVSTLEAEARSTNSVNRAIDERKLTQTLSGELDWIVMKSLEKDRQRRYESASAFAADIQRYLDDQPVESCPPSLAYRARKYARRNRVAATATAIVMLTVVASSVFSAWKFADERAARHDADEQGRIALAKADEARQHAIIAGRERDVAQEQRDIARRNLYFADMGLAFSDAQSAENLARLQRALSAHVPRRGEPDQRSWEWYYLAGRSEQAERTLRGHSSQIWQVAWSPDGRYLASTGYDSGGTKLWETATWNLLRTFNHGGSPTTAVVWSPDSAKLAWGSVSDESALRIWDRETDAMSIVLGHPGSIWAAAWSHNGKRVATGSIYGIGPSVPGNICIFDSETRECVAQITVAGGLVFSLGWSVDDRLLAVATEKRPLTICDVSAGTSVEVKEIASPSSVAWHPTDMRLAVGYGDGKCFVWDQPTQKVLLNWKAHSGGARQVEWSPDGTNLLSVGGDGRVRIWDGASGRELRTVLAHAGGSTSVSWEPSGERFAAGGMDNIVRVWAAGARPSPLIIDAKLLGEFDVAWDAARPALLVNSIASGKVVAFDANSGQAVEEVTFAQDDNHQLASYGDIVERPSSTTREILPGSSQAMAEMLGKAVKPLRLGWTSRRVLVSPDGHKRKRSRPGVPGR